MTEFATFGDPARFEIALRWIDDPEPRRRRPAHGGWSTGELRLTVGEQVLTRHRVAGQDMAAVRWYLLPVFEWLAMQWVSLLHEERFTWRENSAAPAATAVFLALRRLIAAEDAPGRAAYSAIRNWWSRHALRAADPSALYPDVVLRRLGDSVELSWTARAPIHAPDGFQVSLAPGAAIVPISDIAGPLWEALAWAVSTPRDLSRADREQLARLEHRIATLAALPTLSLEAGFLPADLLDRVTGARQRNRLPDTSCRMAAVPALTRLDDAVLMFGGVNPDIGTEDINSLTAFVAAHAGGTESMDLRALVDPGVGAPLSAPFEEGYDLAERLLDQRSLPGGAPKVDVRTLLAELGITVERCRLTTRSIRGAALAGAGFAPAILINGASPYNRTEEGRRFTLAHELSHILYDRAHAARVAHSSGPWAPQGVEKRANAFAAMLLMPRELVRRSSAETTFTAETVRAAAATMEVSLSALLEHLFNIGVIDEFERDDLRTAFGRTD